MSKLRDTSLLLGKNDNEYKDFKKGLVLSMKKQLIFLSLLFNLILGVLSACSETAPSPDVSSDIPEPTSAVPTPTVQPPVATGNGIIPDLNFETAVREQINKMTGKIKKSDVKNITKLDVSQRDITDLSGIEYFTALSELDCAANYLTSLDVSKNTKLTMLNCSNNQLTKLDVGNLTALEDLLCSSNPLTTLNVKRNSALEALYCEDNGLMVLDVSKNPLLSHFLCGANKLTTLDVSRNSKLEILSCYQNQLTRLDLSQNPALISLSCQDNRFPDKSSIIGLDESKLDDFFFDSP